MYVQTGSQKKDLGSSRNLSRAKEFSPWQGKAGCGLGDMGGPGMWALYSSVCLTDGRMDPIISWAFPSQPPSVTISRSGAILSFSSLWKALVMFCTFVTSFMQQPFTDPLGVWIYNVIVFFIVFVDLRLESLWCYRLGWICKVAEGARYTSPSYAAHTPTPLLGCCLQQNLSHLASLIVSNIMLHHSTVSKALLGCFNSKSYRFA